MSWTYILTTVALLLAQLGTLLRAILRPNREPASRLAWVIILLTIPLLGVVAYLVLGEARVGAKRRRLAREIDRTMPRPPADPAANSRLRESYYEAPFALGRTVNRLDPSGGNSATISDDSNANVDAMVADIDAATDTVHACFYIWLIDGNGTKLKDAMIRAARRGVTVRVLADALGSRTFIRSDAWRDMRKANVHARVALPVGNLLWTLIRGRVDLRNHRKLLVLDNKIAWCGSQNAADPEFRIKARFAPWVDVMMRWEGPVVGDMQFLFLSDWLAESGEDLGAMLAEPPPESDGPVDAQVIGTGPTRTFAAMSACFTELIHSARTELVVSTPYFVPDERLLFALINAARRGVRTVLVMPARNDSRIVAAASRSQFRDLLECGVEVYLFEPGLLHAKTMVVDGRVALVGSANLDRRSFELNFENNVLFDDPGLAAEVRRLQDGWIAKSRKVRLEKVLETNVFVRLWRNLLAMLAPLL